MDDPVSVTERRADPLPSYPSLLASVAWLAGPAVVTMLCRTCAFVVSFAVASRVLGTTELAGYVLGLNGINMLGNSVGMGIALALDTVCPHEHGREAHSPQLGLHLRRAIVLITLYFALLTVFLLSPAATAVLRLVVSDNAVLPSAVLFMRINVAATFCSSVGTAAQKFLNAQHDVRSPLVAQIVSALSLLPALWLLAPHGLAGVAAAIAVCRAVFVVSIVAFGLRCRKARRAFGEWPAAEVLRPAALIAFGRESLHTVFITCAERWAWASLAFIAAPCGRVVIDAWGVITHVWLLVFAFPVGTYTAASTLTGNALGRGDAGAARRSAWAAVWAQLLCQVLVASLCLFAPRLVAAVFTADAAITATVAGVLPLLAVAFFCDSVNYTLQAIQRVAGCHTFLSVSTMAAQWAVGTGGALLLAPRHGLVGICAATSAGFAIMVMLAVGRVATLDWTALAAATKSSKDRTVLSDSDETSVADCPVSPSSSSCPSGDEELRPITGRT